jgi:hypothetical protein
MRSTHFQFEHKVFAVEGARFALSAEREPMFYVTLGKLDAALRLPLLCSEFGIAPESPDGRLLAVVAEGLRYVKEIRPGDSVPRELLDGSASWSVEEWHLVRARQRLVVQLAAHRGGRDAARLDDAGLTQLADDPETKRRFAAGLDDIADRLQLAGGRAAVEARLELIAREFAYIEALRERFDLVRGILDKTEQVVRAFRGDRGMVQDVSRIRTLLLKPLGQIAARFDELYADTGEIAGVLRMLDAHVTLIRQVRDELHARLLPWDPVVAQWQMLVPSRSPATEAAVRQLYQFAAQHFAQGKDW